MLERKVVIFGAGFYGKLAFEQYGAEAVAYFVDNNPDKQGHLFCGKQILAPEVLKSNNEKIQVIVASLYQESMIRQLEAMGITDFSSFLGEVHGFYHSKKLIINPYEVNSENTTEEQWFGSAQLDYSKKEVYQAVEHLYHHPQLFNHIEVETINRCNGICSFCPVNRNVDPREKAIMTDSMFESILKQLEEIKYAGRFTTFSNNEPLLDDRIVRFNQDARERLPNARIHLYTNGTLLTMDIFLELIRVLDELIIDNYQQELKLLKPCAEIQEYSKTHPEILSKVTIVLRKPNEILTSRGGDAPNRKQLKEYSKERCVLPFKQMIIRPTGEVSLCCNDALGKYSLGDLTKERLLEVWYGSKFQMVRKRLYEGRENWGNCKYCDAFSMG